MLRWAVSPAAAAVFAAATVSKALEPIAVGRSSHGADGTFPFAVGWAIVVIEMVKLAVCAAALLLQLRSAADGRERSALTRLETVQLARLAIPGLLLACTNWLMFAALSTLDPLLYQVVIKAVIITSTAVLSHVLLRKTLHGRQWVALGALVAGCMIATVPDLRTLSAAAAASTVRGLWLAVAASICFALQAVYFEMVTNEQEGVGQSIWWQSIQAGVYGVLANVALLIVLGDSLGQRSPASAEELGCFGLGPAGWRAVLVVSAADITMNVAFKTLGANVYSFVRAGSFVLSAGVATVLLGHRPSAGFCVGATVVLLAGERFSQAAAAAGEGAAPEGKTSPSGGLALAQHPAVGAAGLRHDESLLVR
jgi:drug/metabolite transporter (DMT)-like permease